MRDPDEALREARRRASTEPPTAETPWHLPDPTASARALARWSLVEPDEALVYSTRRFGYPVTLLKRLLIRLLRQYHGQTIAQQNRFNAGVAAHVVRLEERVAELERRSGEGSGTVQPDPEGPR